MVCRGRASALQRQAAGVHFGLQGIGYLQPIRMLDALCDFHLKVFMEREASPDNHNPSSYNDPVLGIYLLLQD